MAFIISKAIQYLTVLGEVNEHTNFFPSILEGVIIVDSSGIGESEIMDNVVVNYLPNAFAFIYVINSGMAGGVQKDQVRV